jgi:hypothetical protein
MLGREAAPLAPTPIRKAQTPRERCCASSSSIASLRKSEAKESYLSADGNPPPILSSVACALGRGSRLEPSVPRPLCVIKASLRGDSSEHRKRSRRATLRVSLGLSARIGDRRCGCDASHASVHCIGVRASQCGREKAVWCRVRLRAPVSLGMRAWSKRRVTIRTREIYHSANGDRWLLARDPDTGKVFVRHEPNLPSGGQVADIEVGAFLIAAGNGPEKQELLRLIGTLV